MVVVVSGLKDGSAAIWDLNRGMYVRSIWHGEGRESTMVNLFAINGSTVRASAADMEDTDGVSVGLNHDLFAIETLSPYYQHPAHSNSGPHHNTILFKAHPLHECDYSYPGVLANGGPNDPITLRTWTADGTPEG